ncbi:GNAT family N-acetyltransferase [Roseateles sp.]|jgi:GNAT superfamily N-acetyltransferase|uniref:GNAT family N-acetyltransferase n=1 Tax=Roseateles sp. TaxID=1971397 RepID=UPI0037C69D1F
MNSAAPSCRVAHDWDEADLELIHGFISRSYWAEGMPRDLLARAMRGSLNFLLRTNGDDALIGYARVISDRATFAYLCDVFVLEDWRGRGLARKLMAAVMTHEDLQGLRRFSLFTRDAHSLYARHGFKPLAAPERGMEIVRPGLYLSQSES